MVRSILFIFLLASVSTVCAQSSDFIMLKKKSKTIHSYYAGTQIELVTTNGVYKDALITKIANDTIYLQEFLVHTAMTGLGFYIRDTVGSYRYMYDYRQIASIGGKPQKGFNVKGSGAALFGGGTILTLGSGVVYLADRKKFSPALMIVSAALAGVGYLLMKTGNKGIVIGKKHYRLEYMNMANGKK